MILIYFSFSFKPTKKLLVPNIIQQKTNLTSQKTKLTQGQMMNFRVPIRSLSNIQFISVLIKF